MNFMLRLFEEWRRGRAAHGVPVGRPFSLTAEQIGRTHALVTAGEIDLHMAADQFGVHKDTVLRGFRRHALGWNRPGANDGGGDG